MRTISTAVLTELEAEESQGYTLIKISMTSTYHYTDCDIPIYYGGDKYLARGFQVNGIEQSPGFANDAITLELDNADRTFSQIVLSEDAALAPVSVYYTVISGDPITGGSSSGDVEFIDADMVWTDADVQFGGGSTAPGASLQIGTIELYNGFLSEWSLTETRMRMKLASEFAFWHKKSLRLPTPNCPWAFKSSECAYAGAETLCDKTHNRCVVLGNSSNFGGRKFVADVEDQEIYWGPK